MRLRDSSTTFLLIGLLGCAVWGGTEQSAPTTEASPDVVIPSAAAPPPQPPLVGKAKLTGDVVDYHGRPLAGALVTARDARLGWNVSVFTDGNGSFA
ncbi:MAG: carboxypeptidase regulatory-like domain-containing protein, partial [Myxococcales bacterium]|nr:carboxypeptidase regulatory-like domain-containing protein [Myxococcales bacterium]